MNDREAHAYRRAEMEEALKREPGLEKAGKSFVAEYAAVGGISWQQAGELSVEKGKTYCPRCDRETKDDVCPVHGQWW